MEFEKPLSSVELSLKGLYGIIIHVYHRNHACWEYTGKINNFNKQNNFKSYKIKINAFLKHSPIIIDIYRLLLSLSKLFLSTILIGINMQLYSDIIETERKTFSQQFQIKSLHL